MTEIKALAEKLEGWSDVVRGTGKVALSADLGRAAAALRDLTEWRDISTAPKDGTLILCFYPDRHGQDRLSLRYWAVGDWPSSGRTEGWSDQHRQLRRTDPTHWPPLPSAPNQAKEAGE